MGEKKEGKKQRSCKTGCAGLNTCQQGKLPQGVGPTARHRLPLSEAASGGRSLQVARLPCDVVWLKMRERKYCNGTSTD